MGCEHADAGGHEWLTPHELGERAGNVPGFEERLGRFGWGRLCKQESLDSTAVFGEG